MSDPHLQWHPIASSSDLIPRHVFHAQLLGQEMAVWRADDEYVNVWENRCLHRGVRLSIGINDGVELKCQYHGWRYSNRSANCTYIPAHPADAPARTVCNRRFPVKEQFGLIWTALEDGGPFDWSERVLQGFETLRPLPINAPADMIISALGVADIPDSAEISWSQLQAEVKTGAVVLKGSGQFGLIFFVQPVDTARSVIRGLAKGIGENTTRHLRHLNTVLTNLRSQIETDAASKPAEAPIEPTYTRVDAELATMPDRGKAAADGTRVRVLSKTPTATDIMRFELAALEGDLPTGQAGAHIDVHLPNGLTRQYSLTNGPGETSNYTIGVKRELESKGGSECLHDVVREGDVLSVSVPRNNYPLRRDAIRSVFVAGGIGITPLIAMAKTLDAQRLDYELHYFVRADDHIAFRDQIDMLTGRVVIHTGLSPDDTSAAFEKIYAGFEAANHTYICGPGPMLDAARSAASRAGWPDDAVHFEYFKNTTDIDDSSSFEIALARSGQTLTVNAGETILQVLQSNKIAIASSCCQGACGTCKVAVIEGEVDHQDVHLTEAEKQSNAYVMTCVSRAKSGRLVLDI